MALTGLAAASTSATLSIAKGVTVKSKVENVVVNTRGVTVYTLSGEAVHHLKCTKANTCFSFWFPVTAKSRVTAAPGIRGKLGSLRRNGFAQITLAGHPLYTFLGDAGKKRRASGEGIASFGGTWHVIATSSSHPATRMSSPTTGSTPTTPTAPHYP